MEIVGKSLEVSAKKNKSKVSIFESVGYRDNGVLQSSIQDDF